MAAERVLMRPEAAFPYVSAAEGAQHPHKKAATLNDPRCSTLAAAPAQKAATLNDPRCNSRHAKSRDLRGAIWPESSLLWR